MHDGYLTVMFVTCFVSCNIHLNPQANILFYLALPNATINMVYIKDFAHLPLEKLYKRNKSLKFDIMSLCGHINMCKIMFFFRLDL